MFFVKVLIYYCTSYQAWKHKIPIDDCVHRPYTTSHVVLMTIAFWSSFCKNKLYQLTSLTLLILFSTFVLHIQPQSHAVAFTFSRSPHLVKSKLIFSNQGFLTRSASHIHGTAYAEWVGLKTPTLGSCLKLGTSLYQFHVRCKTRVLFSITRCTLEGYAVVFFINLLSFMQNIYTDFVYKTT